MDAAELKQLMMALPRLTLGQKADLLAALGAAGEEQEVRSLLESRLSPALACPHCQGTKVVRNGSASGLQRYKCRSCSRTFNALSTTPLARLRMKGKWLQQQEVMLKGLSVNRAAAELEVAATTAFRWRHRFLELAQAVKAPALTGVVEADETYFLRSSKGQRPGRKPRKRGGRASRKDRGMDLIPILVARDRSGATADFLLEAVSKACLSQALQPRIHGDAILCTDGSAAMAATAHGMGLQHEAQCCLLRSTVPAVVVGICLGRTIAASAGSLVCHRHCGDADTGYRRLLGPIQPIGAPFDCCCADSVSVGRARLAVVRRKDVC